MQSREILEWFGQTKRWSQPSQFDSTTDLPLAPSYKQYIVISNSRKWSLVGAGSMTV